MEMFFKKIIIAYTSCPVKKNYNSTIGAIIGKSINWSILKVTDGQRLLSESNMSNMMRNNINKLGVYEESFLRKLWSDETCLG